MDAAGPDGVTPLHDAAVNGHEHIISLLLSYGADASLKTATKKTAQDLAVSPQVLNVLAKQVDVVNDENDAGDENSPEQAVFAENSWKRQKCPKSRRNLQFLGKFNLKITLVK